MQVTLIITPCELRHAVSDFFFSTIFTYPTRERDINHHVFPFSVRAELRPGVADNTGQQSLHGGHVRRLPHARTYLRQVGNAVTAAVTVTAAFVHDYV